MKPITYYTTVTQETNDYLDTLPTHGKLQIATWIMRNLMRSIRIADFEIDHATVEEIAALNYNQALGLAKALIDQCQETLISK